MAKKKRRSFGWLFASIGIIALIALVVIITLGDLGEKAVVEANDLPLPVVTANPADELAVQALAIRNRDVLLPGTSVMGVNVGDMSVSEAREAVQAALYEAEENFSLDMALRLSAAGGSEAKETTVTLTGEGLEFVNDLDTVLQEAYDSLRESESDAEVVAFAEQVASKGQEYAVSSVPTEESVAAFVAVLALEHNIEAVNATISVDGTKLAYSNDKPGIGIDQETLTANILAAAAGGEKTLEVPTKTLEPIITRSMLENQYVLRAKFSTSFSGSTSDRKSNVKKGSGLINGTVLAPGDVFSTNDILGVRTVKNGWKMAGAYVQGNVEQQAGGGVCQLSSTLYSAVVMSDLEIVFRRNHSMKVGYVSGGLDATINSTGNIIDFKFKNNTSGSIIVVSYTIENKVYMEIYGIPFETTEYDQIKLSSKRTKTVAPTTQEVKDPKAPGGTQIVTREGKQGEVWEAYKEYYKDGKLVKKEPLNTSTYGMVTKMITIGTGPTPSPSPTPGITATPKPTATPKLTPTPSTPDNTPNPTPAPDDGGIPVEG